MRTLFWIRSDLRLRDNRGLERLAARSEALAPVYILDPRLLDGDRSGTARTRFLLEGVARLAADLAERGSSLIVRRGRPEDVLPRLVDESRADVVGFNRDYGPFAAARDERVRAAVEKAGARVETWKDRVVFESREVCSASGRPYAVYSPYRKAWRARWLRDPELPVRASRLPAPIPSLASDDLPAAAARPADSVAMPDLPPAGEAAARRRLRSFLARDVARYAERRDYPALDATSRLSPYLRFGMLSVRDCIEAAETLAVEEPGAQHGVQKWVDELIWREFYNALLAEHPRVRHQSYRREYDDLAWEDDPEGFAAWCEGRTGYPIVDAGMRQLAATGWVHNRVRMIAASFLTKDLLVDWRRGEDFFYRHLVDGDLASNNGGWQWAASTGTDAQPYFRIFNPTLQGERFDPDGDYVRRWIPELAALGGKSAHRPWDAPMAAPDYPQPIVDHAWARQRALARFEALRSRAAAERPRASGRKR